MNIASAASLEPLEGRTLLAVVATTGNSLPDTGVVFGGNAYFVADDGAHGRELWRSNGNGQGTSLLLDITPGPDSTVISSPLVFDGSLYFFADTHLWKSDGTPGGTQQVSSASYGTTLRAPDGPVVFGNAFYFLGLGPQGVGLYKSDGTAGGTNRIAQLDSTSRLYAAPNGLVIFANHDYSVRAADRVYVSDSSGNLNEISYQDYFHTEVTTATFDGALYLSMPLRGLIRTDGTLPGTQHLSMPYATGMSELNGKLLLHVARTSSSPAALWATDGTAAGSEKILDLPIDPAAISINSLPGMFTVGSHAVFFTSHSFEGHSPIYTVWTTDGTAAGTHALDLPDPGTIHELVPLQAAGGRAYFYVYRDGFTELWSTNGTQSGTALARRIDVSLAYNAPFLSLGSSLLFSADDGTTGLEPWRSDGTPNGTVLVKDINELSAAGAPELEPGGNWYFNWPYGFVTDAHPMFTGQAPAGSTVVLFNILTGDELGRAVTAANGVYHVTPSMPVDGTGRFIVDVVQADASGNATPPSLTDVRAIVFQADVTGPSVGILFYPSPDQRLSIYIPDRLRQRLELDDIVVQQAKTGVRIPSSAMTIDHDSSGVSTTIRFSAFPGGKLPPGIYRVTIARNRLVDRIGNLADSDAVFTWSVDRARVVTAESSSSLVARGPAGVGRNLFAVTRMSDDLGGTLIGILDL